jgi:chromosomal replication initiation ATPase DnaA
MSQNRIPANLPSVEKLLTRVTAAEKSQQKEIRITIQEARELTTELALLTSRLGITIQEINEKISKITENSGTVDIKLDGGTF